jgi:hypothetical protein
LQYTKAADSAVASTVDDGRRRPATTGGVDGRRRAASTGDDGRHLIAINDVPYMRNLRSLF